MSRACLPQHFRYTRWSSAVCRTLTRRSCPEPPPVPTLTSVNLQDTGVSRESLRALYSARQLNGLYLSQLDSFDDASLGELAASIPTLHTLSLIDLAITDSGLEHLDSLALLTLTLRDADLTSAAVRHLEGLTTLRVLRLGRTLIDDAAVPALATLTGLKQLELTETGITEEGVARLQEALPNCRITHESISDPDGEAAE